MWLLKEAIQELLKEVVMFLRNSPSHLKGMIFRQAN